MKSRARAAPHTAWTWGRSCPLGGQCVFVEGEGRVQQANGPGQPVHPFLLRQALDQDGPDQPVEGEALAVRGEQGVAAERGDQPVQGQGVPRHRRQRVAGVSRSEPPVSLLSCWGLAPACGRRLDPSHALGEKPIGDRLRGQEGAEVQEGRALRHRLRHPVEGEGKGPGHRSLGLALFGGVFQQRGAMRPEAFQIPPHRGPGLGHVAPGLFQGQRQAAQLRHQFRQGVRVHRVPVVLQ
uniref:Uncharacterized protein n=1 Tax=Candidatus Kentrum eta TaxID=2126337 RepID=A0A450VHZ9_9GAMM|nr:MAG: hypothetical protein BECKH772B_GA0070898_104212 [Candidatus Kentron sp. H]VFK04419.1 MAG: hypothetical protein BECKH772A_GA0070896_104132 [Candidatus Kentron sp. H]